MTLPDAGIDARGLTMGTVRHSRPWRRAALLGPLFAALLWTTPVGAVAGWSGPTQIGSVADCTDVAVAVDAAGGRHVAASCGGSVRYLSDADGEWATTTFSHPVNRADLGPKIAIDGDTIHVAYTRYPSGTGTFAPIGVYHRERALDGDAWSTAVRIGSSGDLLGDFTVIDGVVHATVTSRTGASFYETDVSGSLRRFALPDATSPGSLHVENDHAARFVYETSTFLRYAVFHGSGFDWSIIPRTDSSSEDPQLVLDNDNKSHVTWTQVAAGGAAAIRAGAYYATNRSGVWTGIGAGKVTANVGTTSLEVDLATGRPHVVVATSAAVKYYTPASARAWAGITINVRAASDVDVAIDRNTGQVVVVSSGLAADLPATLFVSTRP